MRKIYFYLPDYPKWSTGGHKYHTIVYEYFRSKNSEVYSFGHNRFTKSIETNKFLKILFGIYYTIKIPRKSIIVTSNTSFLQCYIPVILNKLWKNHFYFLIVHHLVRDEKPSFLRMKLEDYFIRKAGHVLTVSSITRQKLYSLNLNLKNIEVVNPGLDVNIKEIDSKRNFPEKLKILFVGTVEKRKGLIYLIDALNSLMIKDYELNIIGEATYSKDYLKILSDKVNESGLKEKVFFRGRVSREELQEFYLNSSVFVFPSLWEGYGMVIAEAMAYGLPVIATRIPAIEELIDDNVDGLLVEPKNSKQISEKINELCSDNTRMKKLSENASSKVRTFPDWKETSEKIYKIIKNIPSNNLLKL